MIEGATGSWEVVIGLEVHAQVISDAKLFSGAATAFGAEPNTQVSFIDAAMPGTLPVINEACVAQAVRTGLGLNAEINRYSVFDRKNYFYPDLPPNYQISQYAQPVVGPGMVRGRSRGRVRPRSGHRASAFGTGCGEEPARPAPRRDLRGSQSSGRGPHGDRFQARSPRRRGSRRLHSKVASHPALPRHLRRQHGAG